MGLNSTAVMRLLVEIMSNHLGKSLLERNLFSMRKDRENH